MNLDELTIGQARELTAIFGTTSKKSDDAHWEVGENYFVRTVTHHLLGTLVKVSSQELVLTDCSWIADDGRFSEMLSSGVANEVEPFPDDTQVIVGRGSLIDAVRWNHALLRAIK